jgi:hypothetical protein
MTERRAAAAPRRLDADSVDSEAREDVSTMELSCAGRSAEGEHKAVSTPSTAAPPSAIRPPPRFPWSNIKSG